MELTSFYDMVVYAGATFGPACLKVMLEIHRDRANNKLAEAAHELQELMDQHAGRTPATDGFDAASVIGLVALGELQQNPTLFESAARLAATVRL